MRLSVLYTPLVGLGGAERQLFEEAREFVTAGIDVRLLTFAAAEGVVPPDLAPHLRVLRAKTLGGRAVALRRAIRDADVLIAHTSPELVALAMAGSRTPYALYQNSPPFYRGGVGAHMNPYMSSRRYRRDLRSHRDVVAAADELMGLDEAKGLARVAAELRTALKHRALRRAKAVVVLSDRTRRELARLHGVDAVVIRGCLADPGGGERGLRAATVLSVSRLEPVKRIDLLLSAFARVQEERPDARLVIAGDGSDRPRLEAIAAQLELSDRVRFCGFVADDELERLYRTADVFAAPAMADFNIAPYEALAAGMKVVWTTEMETDDALAASSRVFEVPPTVDGFADGLARALSRDAGPAPDLTGLTWRHRTEALLQLVASAR